MNQRPSQKALDCHKRACESGDSGYVDPDTGLFVMTSVYLRERGDCCGSGCRHCPYSLEERDEADRPDLPVWPWPE